MCVNMGQWFEIKLYLITSVFWNVKPAESGDIIIIKHFMINEKHSSQKKKKKDASSGCVMIFIIQHRYSQLFDTLYHDNISEEMISAN